MVKPFYKFGERIFREELAKEYIVPVVRWLLHDDNTSGFLLPQFSGSVWECSLAIDFLLRVLDQPTIDTDRILITKKVVNTARWLIGELTVEKEVEGKSWDSAPWDTAVALRSLLSCFSILSSSFSTEEHKKFDSYTIDICKWLLIQSKNWKGPDGYLTADSTDLAVTLSVLILVQNKIPVDFLILEEQLSQSDSITATAHMLMQCVSDEAAPNRKFNLDNWGGCFTIGEVICGLCTYLSWDGCNERDSNEARALVLEGLKSIEYEQNHGGITNNSVADSCGITWCYLIASGAIEDFGHDDTMVFRSLCWMCDSNKVLDDGSFLHSSYPTVFYALSLIETYVTWELGRKSTNEVYHYVVWLNPNNETLERAKRLDLELKTRKYKNQVQRLKSTTSESYAKLFAFFISISLFFVTLVIMQSTGAVKIMSVNLQMMDTTMFFSELGVALVVVPSLTKFVHDNIKQRYASGFHKKKKGL